jgi:cellulose biosynthesis protein BcsQ
MVDRRRALHQQLIASTRAEFPAMLSTEVPYWSEIERMSVRRAPLPACAPKSDAARIYRELWAEIRERLQPPEQEVATIATESVTSQVSVDTNQRGHAL